MTCEDDIWIQVDNVTVGENIVHMRKMAGLTQSQLAEQIGVARQTVAKWESDAASPDLANASALANVLDVSLDTLVGVEPNYDDVPFLPRGKKAFGTSKLGSYGTVRIPEEALEMFDLKTGDELVVLANPNYGIGICRPETLRGAIRLLEERLLGK